MYAKIIKTLHLDQSWNGSSRRSVEYAKNENNVELNNIYIYIYIFFFQLPAKIQKVDKVCGKDPELSLLVKAVKRKTQSLHKGSR